MDPEEIRLVPLVVPPRGPSLLSRSPAPPGKGGKASSRGQGSPPGLRRAVRAALEEAGLPGAARRGDRVALTAGSRGIHCIVPILAEAAAFLEDLGAAPFLCPAMGSHGGGTAAGRAALLGRLGIDEASVGAPLRSTVESVPMASPIPGLYLYMDRFALEADHIVVVNRVKAHTRFTGPVQSGLCKMSLVGLGGPAGAREIHRAALATPFEEIVRGSMPLLAARTPLSFGIALVENGKKKLGALKGAAAERFVAVDEELLGLAEEWMPRLPFARVDLLVVDRVGKDISGTGMDTNVIGRKEDRAEPSVLRIFARELTKASQGNATGIGFADAVTERLAARIDPAATVLNSFTALRPEGARVPAVFKNDREAISALLETTGRRGAREVRLVRIASTASLERIMASEPLLAEVEGRGDVRIAGRPRRLAFDGDGFLEDLS